VRTCVNGVARAVLAGAVLTACSPAARPGTEEYVPEISPENFTTVVDNPFFPLEPGTTLRYRTPDGSEEVEVTVTEETRSVMGVECRVVRSSEYEDGDLVEVTGDWYAQDAAGSVWYFGEDTRSYGEDGAESRAGSWEAGVDGAQPGIIMPGQPVVGEPYRQEYYAGHAEDMGRVEHLDGTVAVPYGSFDGVLVTRDWTPLEPGLEEHKYYVRGVGLVLEDEGRTRVELIEVTTDAQGE
jgi:hypothetical protein